MKITRIRTIAIAYPCKSLEAEVLTDEGKKIYLNFDHRDSAEECIENNEYWMYEKPLDELLNEDWDESKLYDEIDENVQHDVIRKMKNFFDTKMNGEWDKTNQWHKYTE